LVEIVFRKELHSHDGENEDNYDEDEDKVTESAHGFAHNGNEEIECGPGFREFEDSEETEGTQGRDSWEIGVFEDFFYEGECHDETAKTRIQIRRVFGNIVDQINSSKLEAYKSKTFHPNMK